MEGDYKKAIPLFEDAIAKDSGFAAAYVQLAWSLANAGLQPRRLDSLRATAHRLRDRLPEAERFEIEGTYLAGRDRRKAIVALQRSVAIDSFNVNALNTLAYLYAETRDRARVEVLYRRGLVVEPENGILFANLIQTLGERREFTAADSLIRVMRARKIPFPTEPLEVDLLYQRRELDSAEARARAALRRPIPGFHEYVMERLGLMTLVRGRLEESYRIAHELRARRAAQGTRVDSLTIPTRMSLNDAWLHGRSERAVARLDSAVRVHPLTPASPPGAMLEVAHAYAIAGQSARGRAILARYDAASRDSVNRTWFPGHREWTEGAILLAERRTDEAIRVFRRMDTLPDGLPIPCEFCLPVVLSRAYDQANAPDSTIANLERYLATPNIGRIYADSWMLGPAHKRLGELYEAKGDHAKAMSHYTEFVELWERADPDLQPKVAEVRVRLERLRRTLPQ